MLRFSFLPMMNVITIVAQRKIIARLIIFFLTEFLIAIVIDTRPWGLASSPGSTWFSRVLLMSIIGEHGRTGEEQIPGRLSGEHRRTGEEHIIPND